MLLPIELFHVCVRIRIDISDIRCWPCLLVLTYVLTDPWVAVTVADASVSASGAPAHPLVAVRRTPRYQRVRTSVAMSTGCVAMVGWR